MVEMKRIASGKLSTVCFLSVPFLRRGTMRASFEGVCLTIVILAPGVCGRGVRAAAADTFCSKSGGSGGSRDEFQNFDLC